VKLSRREKTAEAEVVEAPSDETDEAVAARKGRPTPKRRDSQGKRGPVSAPKTRKEAYARQKQLAKQQKSAQATAKPRTVAEQRAALKRGDVSALPRRDQGKTRKLARDYVDSHRMLSNYLLFLFPVMVAGIVPALSILQIVVLVVFIGLLVEWYIVGRRIRALSIERFGEAQGGNLSIGFYAGSRAYLPRRWRLPAPQVDRGDPI
jgi:Flp pilus assembly protein TadB